MPRLPVLTFHTLDSQPTPVAVEAGVFRGMVDRIAASGYASCPSADVASTKSRASESVRRVVFTFDDGYVGVIEACAALVARGFRATLFLAPSLIGRERIFPGEALCPPQRALTWAEARALATEGHEIGSHAFDHVDLRKLDDAALQDQMTRSKAALEDGLGTAVTTFAYPFGFHDERVVAAAAGVYDAAFTTRLAFAPEGGDPHRIPRLDACYLKFLARRGDLDSMGTRAYLGLRGAARSLRTAFSGGRS